MREVMIGNSVTSLCSFPVFLDLEHLQHLTRTIFINKSIVLF